MYTSLLVLADALVSQRDAHVSRSIRDPNLPQIEQGTLSLFENTTLVALTRMLSDQTGFLKAFSDQPEAFTFGLSPLQTTLMQLKIREVSIYPR